MELSRPNSLEAALLVLPTRIASSTGSKHSRLNSFERILRDEEDQLIAILQHLRLAFQRERRLRLCPNRRQRVLGRLRFLPLGAAVELALNVHPEHALKQVSMSMCIDPSDVNRPKATRGFRRPRSSAR